MWKSKKFSLIVAAGTVLLSQNCWGAVCDEYHMLTGTYNCLDGCNLSAASKPQVVSLGGGDWRLINEDGNATLARPAWQSGLGYYLHIFPGAGWPEGKAFVSGIQHCIIKFEQTQTIWMQ